VRRVCGVEASDQRGLQDTPFAPFHPDVVGFSVAVDAPDECVHMATGENELVDFVRGRQRRRWKKMKLRAKLLPWTQKK